MATVLLLTRHFNDNPGTVFQAYATIELLKRQGHDVTLVDLSDRSYIREICKLNGIFMLPAKIKYALFRKRFFKTTKKADRLSKIELPNADYFVVGSDQVWNCEVSKNMALDYFLDGISDKYKKISLASSFGIKDFHHPCINQIKYSLSKFKQISVREIEGVSICKSIFGINAIQLIDPTIALGDFTRFINQGPLRNEVLFYSFRPDGYANNIVAYISNQINMPVRRMFVSKKKKYLSAHPYFLGPIEWLNYIAHSHIVVTDSFHGVVFSLLNHKEFVAVKAHENRFGRIESLLDYLGLSHKIVLSLNDLIANYDKIMTPIDYNNIDELFHNKQKEFIEFINKNIL